MSDGRPPATGKRWLWLLVGGCVVAAATASWWLPWKPTPGAGSDIATLAPTIDAAAARAPRHATETQSAPRATPALDSVQDSAALAGAFAARLEQLLDATPTTSDATKVRAELARLKADMLNAPPEAAAAALGAFLASGRDVDTALPFEVGEDGAMAAVPSLRAFALDVLPAVDPELSVSVSRAVLDAADSDVESALALRNLAWNDLDGDMRDELETRFTAFLAHEQWARQPSDAYLNAMDVAVELATPAVFTQLSRLAAATSESVADVLGRAAFIAMDRQVVDDHGILLDALARDPALLAAAPLARVSLMSRLDLTVPAESTALLSFLAAPERSPAELDYFSRLYPNGNYFYGNWLVTASESTPSIATQRTRDRAILAALEQQLAGTPPEPVRATLTKVRERLTRLEQGGAAAAGSPAAGGRLPVEVLSPPPALDTH